MIIESNGSMFHGNHKALVCPVNMVGAMGKGLACYFRDRDRVLYKFYQQACHDTKFAKFDSVIYRGSNPMVVLFPTKVHWSNPSKLEWINKGLAKLLERCMAEGIMEIAMPAIGCGNGELNWEDVRFLIYHHFESAPVTVHLYPPF